MKKVTIIDYGMSNLLSITRAVEKLGAIAELTGDADVVAKSDFLILPGVGAFHDGMKELKERNLPEAIHQFLATGKPFIGICLGMQMMMEEGTENQLTKGLCIIPGTVLPLPEKDSSGNINKIPHIGWERVGFAQSNLTIPFKNIEDQSYMYFVHSFYVKPINKENAVAYTSFNDFQFTSIANKDNAWATQFHPEKSSEKGLIILKNFINLQD